MEYWAAISIGLLGSFHCLGMCGPIALALPLDRTSNWKIVRGSLLYNSGRLLTYFIIGVLLGSIGKTMSFFGAQQYLSLFSGALIILSVFFSSRKIGFPVFTSWLSQIKASMAKRIKHGSSTNLFLIGIFNGLLPCGLVYVALLGAIATSTSLNGGVFMLLFGLGTIPMLLTVNVFGSRLKSQLFPSIKRFIPVFIILIGSLFILRGLGLGVPYLSPTIHPTATIVKCH